MRAWALMLLVVVVGPAWGQRFSHQGIPPQLVELYTSEGCSSCPPADKRLAGLVEHPQLWQTIIPLAFHVDYWDYLGWRDRFAKPEYSQRQWRLKRSGQLRSVYTPGWVVDGQEWRGFFSGQALPDLPQRRSGLLVAELEGVRLQISYQDDRIPESLQLHVAVLGFDQISQVHAGENRGKQLKHQFVVLEKYQLSFDRQPVEMELASREGGGRYAVVVWLQEPGAFHPLQALGGWIRM